MKGGDNRWVNFNYTVVVGGYEVVAYVCPIFTRQFPEECEHGL